MLSVNDQVVTSGNPNVVNANNASIEPLSGKENALIDARIDREREDKKFAEDIDKQFSLNKRDSDVSGAHSLQGGGQQ